MNTPNFDINPNWSFGHCVTTITASNRIEHGTCIKPHHDGTVRRCMITEEILIDPLGDIHFPTIVGYALDDIDDGGIGRVVIAM